MQADDAAGAAATAADHLDDLYREHSLWAARFAYLVTGDSGLAEDLMQEAFIGLYRNAARDENPRAYLRVSLTNLANRARTRERRRTTLHRIAVQREIVNEDSTELFDVIIKLPVKQRLESCCVTTKGCRKPRSPRPTIEAHATEKIETRIAALIRGARTIAKF